MAYPLKRAGDAVFIEITVVDPSIDPPVLFDTTLPPQITIYVPAGTPAQTGSMSRVSVGTYSYTYQTTTNSAVGLWQADFTVTEGAYTSKSVKSVVFNLTA